MSKNLLLAAGLLLGTMQPVSASVAEAKAAPASVATHSLLSWGPRDKSRSPRALHRPNYKRYKGPGNPYRGFSAFFH